MAEKKISSRRLNGLRKNVEGFRKYIARTTSEVIIKGIEKVKYDPNRRFVITCTHRSHTDYLLLASELDKANVNRIRFAAGDNLTKLPILGKKFREMGAFSVFRGKASQRNYLFKLTDQVKRIILNDDLVIVFPEGGRSYDGHMLDLKGGILGSAVVAQHEDQSKEICFIPVGISYEAPIEVPYFNLALKGKKLRDEGSNKLVQLWGEFLYYFADGWAYFKRGIQSSFGKKYGKIFCEFGDPIPVSELTDINKNYKEKAKNSFLANRASIKEVTAKLQDKFIELYRIWPLHILSYYLKENDYKFDNNIEKFGEVVTRLKSVGAHFTFDTNISNEELVEIAKNELKLNGAVKRKGDDVIVKKENIINYFAATVEDRLK